MDKVKAFFTSAVAWVQSHKTISIIVGVVVAAAVIFLTGYIKGCVK